MSDTPTELPTFVIALGGNCIVRAGDPGTIDVQTRRAEEAMVGIADLAESCHRIVLVHGNGPVVGNIVMRSEAARGLIPPMPLYIAGADSAGGIGYVLQQALHNELASRGIRRTVVSLVTQTLVDADDPAFSNPTKPIGPYLSGEEAAHLASGSDWVFAEEFDRGWRRVVPSPLPREIIEVSAVSTLLESSAIVIAGGGGGIPVVASADGRLSGIDAVVDKDWTAALLAAELGADSLVVLMEADRAYLGYGTPDAEPVEAISCEKARELLAEDKLSLGGMAPKIAACAYFAETTGNDALICSSEALTQALSGAAGTRVFRT